MAIQKIIKLLQKPMLFGSITTAKSTCGNPNCACHSDAKKLHGPYYRWTAYVDGKYKCVTLSPEEAKEAQIRTDNYRKIQKEFKKLKLDSLKNAPWISMKNKT